MPMHDWTRVPAGIYHMLHGAWLYTMARTLNNGVLPRQYYALCEQVTTGAAPDVISLELPASGPRPPKLAAGNGVLAVQTEQPPVGVLDRMRLVVLPQSRRRLAVRHVSTHRVVAVIELVSPANKQKRSELRKFVEKAVNVLIADVHLMVIDPFPPSRRDPRASAS